MSYKSFDLLKKLYFVRTGGSKEELEAANIIKQECESLGVEAHLESFKVEQHSKDSRKKHRGTDIPAGVQNKKNNYILLNYSP